MEVIQGYGNEPNITSISDKIIELRNDIFSHSPVRTLDQACGSGEIENTYFIILTWYNRPIAMCAIRWLEKNGHGFWFMYNFGVRTLRRREGWGKSLFNEFRQFLGDKPSMWLVGNDNINAQLFYRKMGANDIGEVKDNTILMLLVD